MSDGDDFSGYVCTRHWKPADKRVACEECQAERANQSTARRAPLGEADDASEVRGDFPLELRASGMASVLHQIAQQIQSMQVRTLTSCGPAYRHVSGPDVLAWLLAAAAQADCDTSVEASPNPVA